MSWTEQVLDQLAAAPVCGYELGGPQAAEPTALAGLALFAHGRADAAAPAAAWLAELQNRDGSVGVTRAQTTPGWPTSLAILLWQRLQEAAGEATYAEQIRLALEWALQMHGETMPRQRLMGHDTTLHGWPWAAGTHSWLEPTALFVLALKAAGQGDHPRTREAVRMLVDRLLPGGGANYGNTIVFGQTLLAHVQPTGLALLALAGEEKSDPRIERSLEYLEQSLSARTPVVSLCYGLMGLAAHGRRPAAADDWLRAQWNSACRPYGAALVGLATAKLNPLLTESAWAAQPGDHGVTQPSPKA